MGAKSSSLSPAKALLPLDAAILPQPAGWVSEGAEQARELLGQLNRRARERKESGGCEGGGPGGRWECAHGRWESWEQVPVYGPYSRVSVIGVGAYGVVLLVQSEETGATLCMKVVDVSSFSTVELMHAMAEVTVLGATDAPSIVNLHESWMEKDDLVIVMEAALNGDLEHVITGLEGSAPPASLVWMWAIELLLALKHLHDRHIIHRDIKTENVFLTDDGHVKLGDFGISVATPDEEMEVDPLAASQSDRFGTPHYFSPEFFASKKVSFKHDMWALGVLLFRLLTGTFPFAAPSLRALRRAVRGQPAVLPSSVAPSELRSFVEDLLAKDPEERPSATDCLLRPGIRTRMELLVPQALYSDEFPIAEDVSYLSHTRGEVEPPSPQTAQPVRPGSDQAGIPEGASSTNSIPSIVLDVEPDPPAVEIPAPAFHFEFDPVAAVAHPDIVSLEDYFAVAETSHSRRERAFAPLAARLTSQLLASDLGATRARKAMRLLKRTNSSADVLDCLREHKASAGSLLDLTSPCSDITSESSPADEAGHGGFPSPAQLSPRGARSSSRPSSRPSSTMDPNRLSPGRLSTSNSASTLDGSVEFLDSDDEISDTTDGVSGGPRSSGPSVASLLSDSDNESSSDGSAGPVDNAELTVKLVEKLEITRNSQQFKALNSMRKSYLGPSRRRHSVTQLPLSAPSSPRRLTRPINSADALFSSIPINCPSVSPPPEPALARSLGSHSVPHSPRSLGSPRSTRSSHIVVSSHRLDTISPVGADESTKSSESISVRSHTPE